MIQIKSFEFSPFSENTYVLSDETKEAVIIDPGCLSTAEKNELKAYIETQNLKIVHLLQSHAHLDHVFGSAWVKRTYGVKMSMHKNEVPVLSDVESRCKLYGIPGYEPVEADEFIDENNTVLFGNSELEIRFVPGHAPGHLAFVSHTDKFIIGGDCLFFRSVGRTDFPFCSHQALLQSINTQFYTLPDDFKVYSGHGPATTIGDEKINNPFTR